MHARARVSLCVCAIVRPTLSLFVCLLMRFCSTRPLKFVPLCTPMLKPPLLLPVTADTLRLHPLLVLTVSAVTSPQWTFRRPQRMPWLL